jgi:Protein of unknown function (DUF3341)
MTTLASPGTHGTGHEASPRRAPAPPRLYGLVAEFDTPAAILHAATETRKAGYRWWDCHTPFAVHGLDKAMGVRPTILPWIVFFAGLTGAILGLVLQGFTNSTELTIPGAPPPIEVTGYPFKISGKPLFSLPAFIPVTFELTILLAALTCVFGMLLLNGLPRLYHPLFRNHRFLRATDDKFFLVLEARDPKFQRGKAEQFLQSLRPASVEAVES